MKNVISFPGLVLVNKPRYYSNSNTVEFMAHDYDDHHVAPRPFKFVFQGPCAKEFPVRFKKGDIVHVKALAEAYKGKIYGKMKRPIKYPDGSFRYTTRVRFHVINIRKGISETP